jgi:hypothetical protein
MKYSCYFSLNHSVFLCPNLYSTYFHNALRTCSILILVLSSASSFWIHFSYKHFAQTPQKKKLCIDDEVTALQSTVRYADMCLQMDCITVFYCCVSVSRDVYRAVAWQCVDPIHYNIILGNDPLKWRVKWKYKHESHNLKGMHPVVLVYIDLCLFLRLNTTLVGSVHINSV